MTKDNNKDFWINSQRGCVVFNPIRLQYVPKPRSENNYKVTKEEPSKPLIDPLTMFAVALAFNQ